MMMASYPMVLGERWHTWASLWMQNVCAVTLFKPPWPIFPSLSMLVSSHGRRSNGRNSHSSSVWKRLSTNANASGEAQKMQQLWDEYFSDPSQWWANNIDKRNPKLPISEHKVSMKALLVDGCSTPSLANVMLKLVTGGKLQPCVSYHTQDSPDTTRPNRVPKDNNGKGKSGPNSTRELRQLDNRSRHMQSASTTSEAISILKNYHQQGITVDSKMYIEVLKRCFKQKDLVSAKQVHDCMTKSGMEQNTYVANNLLGIYIRCGRLQDAHQVFDKLVKKTVVSWNIMIGGYAEHDCGDDAIEVFNKMCQEGPQPNEITFLSILKACASRVGLKWGKKVHAHITSGGFESDVRVGTALVKMYAMCGCIVDARQVFDRMVDRNIITWNTMIAGHARHGFGHEAFSLFLQMQREGFKPDAFTYASILNPCVSTGVLELVKEVHRQAFKAGLESDVRVGRALVHVYAKSGSINDARLVFERMVDCDIITWNMMIGGLAQQGFGHEAFALFLQMQQEGLKPNVFTYVSILNPHASTGALEWVKVVYMQALKAGLESDLRVGNAFVHMYAKSGSIDDAQLVFDRMVDRNIVTWNMMIGGLAKQGFGQEAFALFLQMQQEGFQPDAITYASILNPCVSTGASEWVKEVHRHALKAGLELDLRVGNAFVHKYAKSGNIDDARLVFGRMVDRNIITWNVMIGGLAHHGFGQEAFDLFLQMQREGLKPDACTFVSILNPRASAGALEWVKEVHKQALKEGLELDLRVGNAFVHMYVKSGSVDDARLVFERMVDRDVITWNVMIGGVAAHGFGHEAFALFLQMQQEGFTPNAITYVSILNPSASAGALEWVKEVHREALKAGLESDVRVGSALVHMYAKSGSLNDAQLVFDTMVDRNVITWTVMIGGLAQHGLGHDAFSLFLQMQQKGFKPDAYTYASILNPCASVGALEWVKEVHMQALKAGLESDLRVGNAFVHMYAKSGSIQDAQLIFNRMVDRDLITWNAMIGGLAEHGFGNDAFSLFLQMQRDGFQPNVITFVSILNPCASTGALEWVREVHRQALKVGLESDVRLGNAFVHMYAKSGSIDNARLVFKRMVNRDVITWNMMIGGVAEHGFGQEAFALFLQMQQEGIKPDAMTYASILNPCASDGALEWVKEVHRQAQKSGLEMDLRVGNAFVHMYAKSGSIDDARLVFERMVDRDVITWTGMIGGLAQHGFGHEAFALFLQMQQDGFKPDAITYVSILNPCASTGALEWVKEVQRQALKAGLESDLRVGNAFVHMYSKSGSIDDARLVFDRMVDRDVITWNVMIGGLAQHGLGHEALQVYEKMKAQGVKPDALSFVALFSACSHAGLVDEGRRQFLAMSQDYGIKPSVVHYNCMVDLLGRAGHLEEAKLFIHNMSLEPNGATWGALLGACRTYSNVELGELAFKELLKLQPEDASAYVLLSNIYAAAGKWDLVSSVRNMMQETGIRKEAGQSWIEVDNKIHCFVVGDTSHPEAKEIYAELNILTKKLKAEGYIPDTRFVLHNVNEEDKELALCSHSEKLAIAYGLIRLPPGKPIHIHKNLRVCSDCHTATKFISKVTGREIVARDANRFHQIKDGVCSCGDYW